MSMAGTPSEWVKKGKIFSKKRKEELVTSRLGCLTQQKLPLPSGYAQIVRLNKKASLAQLEDELIIQKHKIQDSESQVNESNIKADNS